MEGNSSEPTGCCRNSNNRRKDRRCISHLLRFFLICNNEPDGPVNSALQRLPINSTHSPSSSPGLVPGLVPAISTATARRCLPNRDGRKKHPIHLSVANLYAGYASSEPPDQLARRDRSSVLTILPLIIWSRHERGNCPYLSGYRVSNLSSAQPHCYRVLLDCLNGGPSLRCLCKPGWTP